MSIEFNILLTTAATIGFFHTLTGPDHYLPFIVMSKARNWSYAKTLAITTICGVGHVGSSILIGALGIAFGWGVEYLKLFESNRGSVAAWFLIIFGFLYFAWGLWKALRKRDHKHYHYHLDGSVHKHNHSHLFSKAHEHPHEIVKPQSITPWILFTVFVLGPCEPLIPILMYPAAKSSIMGVVYVSAVFSLFTIATMIGMVLLSLYGIQFLPIKKFEKYMHAIAGATICLCGIAIVFMGL
jgi:nickel/cobalt transporter (NicO) family protein